MLKTNRVGYSYTSMETRALGGFEGLMAFEQFFDFKICSITCACVTTLCTSMNKNVPILVPPRTILTSLQLQGKKRNLISGSQRFEDIKQ